ncbi:MAG: hypothetical protein J7L89_09630, partial [Bacteroidales bacterium]|nr:hypothetical protein [Bacteroidales bacterium]
VTEEQLVRDPGSYRYSKYLVIILFINYSLGILFYPEPFTLTHHAFSHLGMTHVHSGPPNYISLVINAFGMTACAWVMFRLARYHHRIHPVPASSAYSFFSFLVAIGYLMMLFPCDLPKVRFFHVLGSGLVVGGLVFLVMIRLIAIKPVVGLARFRLLTGAFSLSVLLYAWMWLIHSPINPLFQKIAIIALIFTTLYSFRISKIRGEGKIKI